MDFKALVKPAIKAGLIMAVISLVLGLLGVIPFLGCITGTIGCVLAFIPGLLACFFAERGGKRPSIGEGAILGAMTGPIVALSSLITVPAQMILGGAIQSSMVSAIGADVPPTPVSEIIITVIIATPVVLIISAIVLAVINAGTGAIYAVIKNR